MKPLATVADGPDHEDGGLEALVPGALRGDPRAARALFDGLLPIFVGAGARLLGPRSPDLDDFVQETALRLFRSLPTYRGESRIRWFAYRVAGFTATDWIRSERSLKRARTRESLPEHLASEMIPGAIWPDES